MPDLRMEEAVAKHEPLSAYERGLVQGLYAHSIMRDGVLYVGTGIYTLGQAIDRQITEYRELAGDHRTADQPAPVAERALFIAEHLFPMVTREAWRDSGGDDGQGHYEGDYHAEKVAQELRDLRAALDGT